MGFVSGLFSGDKGANWEAQQAPLITPTNGVQINQDLAKSNAGIADYQKFLQAIQAQGGLQKQGDVYNQLQGVANGTGPNPALATLNNATGANVANQAALMASSRGVGANPGLVARQAANVGAGIQQQAAGQGAVMQANQSLNAIGQAGQLANTMAGQELQGENGLNNIIQNQRAQTLGAAQGYNNAIAATTANQNTTNAGIAQGNQAFQAGTVGGIAKGAGTAIGMADGGAVPDVAGTPAGGPQSATAKFLKDVGEGSASGDTATPQNKAMSAAGAQVGSDIGGALGKGAASAFGPSAAAGGGGGASIIQQAGPAMAMMAAYGGNVGGKLKSGGKVPGQAKVKGDDYANDTVSAKLSPGEVVLPRSVMQSKDPVKAASAFVAAVMAKSGKMPRKS